MPPQVPGQALVGRVQLERDDQLGELVLQATEGHGQTVPADLPRRLTATQIQAGPEQQPPDAGGPRDTGARKNV